MRGSLPGYENEIKAASAQIKDDASLLMDREHTCPVCGSVFKSKAVKMSKILLNGSDRDLRPRFKNLDVLKYQVVECPVCGFADMEKYFSEATAREVAAYRNQGFPRSPQASRLEGPRDYDTAYRHYKAAIRCIDICTTKSGRRAYIALCTAWTLRSWREAQPELAELGIEDDDFRLSEEERLLKQAVKYFKEAERTEDFPICGLQEASFDCMMAALLLRFGDPKEARQYAARALANKSLNSNYRRIAEDIRDDIKART